MKDIVQPGIVDESKSPYITYKNFTSRYGYWNYKGGIIVCFITGHKWKWTKGTLYSDNCWPWQLQCTRCRKQQHPPHDHKKWEGDR